MENLIFFISSPDSVPLYVIQTEKKNLSGNFQSSIFYLSPETVATEAGFRDGRFPSTIQKSMHFFLNPFVAFFFEFEGEFLAS